MAPPAVKRRREQDPDSEDAMSADGAAARRPPAPPDQPPRSASVLEGAVPVDPLSEIDHLERVVMDLGLIGEVRLSYRPRLPTPSSLG